MADPVVINSGATREDTSHGLNYVLGALALIAVMFFLFFYALPLLREAATPSAPSIQVPEQIDVNIQPGQQQ